MCFSQFVEYFSKTCVSFGKLQFIKSMNKVIPKKNAKWMNGKFLTYGFFLFLEGVKGNSSSSFWKHLFFSNENERNFLKKFYGQFLVKKFCFSNGSIRIFKIRSISISTQFSLYCINRIESFWRSEKIIIKKKKNHS